MKEVEGEGAVDQVIVAAVIRRWAVRFPASVAYMSRYPTNSPGAAH